MWFQFKLERSRKRCRCCSSVCLFLPALFSPAHFRSQRNNAINSFRIAEEIIVLVFFIFFFVYFSYKMLIYGGLTAILLTTVLARDIVRSPDHNDDDETKGKRQNIVWKKNCSSLDKWTEFGFLSVGFYISVCLNIPWSHSENGLITVSVIKILPIS